MVKNALSRHFDESVNQCSPLQDDFFRKVNYDEDGNEVISYEKVDYPALQASHGTVDLWSLSALMKAGIDPAFNIHTGLPTRLEGLSSLDEFGAIADSIISESNESNESKD